MGASDECPIFLGSQEPVGGQKRVPHRSGFTGARVPETSAPSFWAHRSQWGPETSAPSIWAHRSQWGEQRRVHHLSGRTGGSGGARDECPIVLVSQEPVGARNGCPIFLGSQEPVGGQRRVPHLSGLTGASRGPETSAPSFWVHSLMLMLLMPCCPFRFAFGGLSLAFSRWKAMEVNGNQ